MKSYFPTRVLVGAAMLAAASSGWCDTPVSYAQRLGWGPKDKVVIFHIDDAGMSHGSNLGTAKALAEGVATSTSIMMPCSWVPEFRDYLKQHPEWDAGLHLTLTSEWDAYRWGPVAGKPAVPGLVDTDGYLWGEVVEVVAHATPQEVETEIRAQLEKAKGMGIKPTHLDSHMGTLFASKAYFERYIQLGIEKGIPVLVAGGHLHFLKQDSPVPLDGLTEMAERVWAGGLPVLDDIHASSYDWKDENKTERFMAILEEMPPGLLEIVIHATEPTDEFPVFTGSAATRRGDLDAMIDAKLREFIVERGIILTTWRELKERRARAGDAK